MIHPWHHAGHRVLGSPFTSSPRAYCQTCGDWTEPKQEARYEGQVHGMKQWCARCGRVLSWGVWNHGHDAALEQRAREWAMAPEADRRGPVAGLVIAHEMGGMTK